jgi:bacterioferritin (cytochrome b1)
VSPARPQSRNRSGATPPAAVIDILNALLESQQNSIIRFMGESSPYVGGASAAVREMLRRLLDNNLKRAEDLYRLIEKLGGRPRPRGLQPEEQYLAYLSIKFLLPKIIDAKELIIRRYENALLSLQNAPPEVTEAFKKQLAEHRTELEELKSAAAAK